MNKEQFIATYMANFLATHMALRYVDDCQNGHEGEPYNHQPVEDAHHLAECAWQQIQDLGISM